ncbi:hypothetical protein BDA99DRAFT_543693 [Phascolomyces articulosus]|uniref:Uncharacterized protein n=1 Tax=Phascolomyces articulosus TaxID=60185 RepID=A0AAD5P936_9FUNG|nr:hypothetical protein BDA99DRAFT_543693 [Phascolomyces articulosus]
MICLREVNMRRLQVFYVALEVQVSKLFRIKIVLCPAISSFFFFNMSLTRNLFQFELDFGPFGKFGLTFSILLYYAAWFDLPAYTVNGVSKVHLYSLNRYSSSHILGTGLASGYCILAMFNISVTEVKEQCITSMFMILHVV